MLRVLLAIAVFWVPGPGWVQANDAEADPLQVPAGRGPEPDENLSTPLVQRLQGVWEARRERGFREAPLLAWALLSRPDMTADGSQIEAALALAPSTPSVRFEAGRQLRSPSEVIQAILTVPSNLPALIWLATVVGGALGAGIRYLLTEQSQRWFGDHFPYGTLIVNVTGCLVLGGLFG